MRILIIEDNQKLSENISKVLTHHGYNVETAFDGQSGLDMGTKDEYDLIILDLNLPLVDGVEVCEKLRVQEIQTPILMLTARIDLESRVSGLDTGADDYLTKPFQMEELMARVRALLRRSSKLNSSEIKIGDVEVDLKSKSVLLRGKEVSISATELKILEHLVFKRGEVCSPIDIYNSVWGDDSMDFSDTLKVHIARIRSKLGKDIIHTVPGLGYIIK